jgi:hypothetical protein
MMATLAAEQHEHEPAQAAAMQALALVHALSPGEHDGQASRNLSAEDTERVKQAECQATILLGDAFREANDPASGSVSHLRTPPPPFARARRAPHSSLPAC